jgi:coenzyme F420-reducing hydrogenase delta subunit
MVVGCRKDACRYIDGIQKVEKKIDLLEINLGKKYSDRVILKHMNAVEGNKFAASINEFYKKLDEAVLIE